MTFPPDAKSEISTSWPARGFFPDKTSPYRIRPQTSLLTSKPAGPDRRTDGRRVHRPPTEISFADSEAAESNHCTSFVRAHRPGDGQLAPPETSQWFPQKSR